MAVGSPACCPTKSGNFIEGILFQNGPGHIFERGLTGGFEQDRAGIASVECLFPASGTDAPSVTRVQSGKAVGGHWRGQVIAGASAEIEEICSDLTADRMASVIFGTDPATPVSIETGERLK